MIVGHGVDVQDVARIRKLLDFAEEDFLLSTFTEAERAIEYGDQERAEFYAGRLAAKEAIAKAIGTGFATGVAPLQIQVLRKDGGQPEVHLSRAALEVANALGINRWVVSISHNEAVAFASAIAVHD
ncbi:holo-ACP synthase [Tautonia rosea]|uniref:holo-ACP synthase n=1 Tax=Tautonia rosea TaxID=2728037 RepID=UPI0014746847|nr:holo-ACP synthase [Tautonia rosea]